MENSPQTGTIGIDEVGRGPLAGPITVCAVYIEDRAELQKVFFGDTIRDSKKLTKLQREKIYETIRKRRGLNSVLKYSVSSRTAAHIDRYGIVASARACITTCMKDLEKQGVDIRKTKINLDAGLKVEGSDFNQESHIRGDEKFIEIALASIVAKVERDAHMKTLSLSFSAYGWEKNAGYGTSEHRKAIEKYGINEYHRKSFLKDFTTIR